MKKNKKLIIIVAILLVGIGLSLAYFMASVIFNGNGAKASGKTAVVEGATLDIDGTLTFNDLSIYPGHKTVSGIVGTAKGDNVLIPYDIIWEGSNSLNTDLNYIVYKSLESVNVETECENKTKVKDGKQYLSEECTISNIDGLDIVNTGTISGNTEQSEIVIVNSEFINATSEGNKVYYYVVIEYPNKEESQNNDLTGSFSGEIKVEINDATPDITIAKIYQENEEKTDYDETNEIPSLEEYVFNEELSTCTNKAIPTWDTSDNSLIVNALSESGTKCNVYFKHKPTGKDTLAKLFPDYQALDSGTNLSTNENGVIEVTGVDTANHEKTLYTAEDNDGVSYFFRGQASDNWVQFANMRWRIIRINGDGTIRMIFQCNGKDCVTTTGEGTNAKSNIEYQKNPYGDNTYVGYYNKASGSSSYSDAHSGSTPSTIAGEVNSWHTTSGLSGYAKYIDTDAGFCNDRQIKCGVDPKTFVENRSKAKGAKVDEVNAEAYTRDLFTSSGAKKGNQKLRSPVGLITADEVALAGGFYGTVNQSYYLYTNENYWTMSPSYFGSGAFVFPMQNNGYFDHNTYVIYKFGVRPVINLKSTTTFKTEHDNLGDPGTVNNPYVVDTSN